MSDTACGFFFPYSYLLAIALSKDLDSIVNLSPKTHAMDLHRS